MPFILSSGSNFVSIFVTITKDGLIQISQGFSVDESLFPAVRGECSKIEVISAKLSGIVSFILAFKSLYN